MTKFVKTLIYKLYVVCLMILVLWAGQFMFPLIFWEIEYVGENKTLKISTKASELKQQQALRKHLDQDVQYRTRHLGDINFTEHYEKGHFHHVGQSLQQNYLNGCDYCHSPFPHKMDEEARAFRNMHGFFVACETCHYPVDSPPKLTEYAWVNLDNGRSIEPPRTVRLGIQQTDDPTLAKAKGNYGARIAPWKKDGGGREAILSRSSLREARWVLQNYESLPENEVKKTLKTMHSDLTKNPLKCNACHAQKGAVISYVKLGYPKNQADKLRDSQAASVIKKYDKFHFPNLFIRKEQRERDKKQEQQRELETIRF